MFGLDDILSAPMSLMDTIFTGGAGGDAQRFASGGLDYLKNANIESGPSAFESTDPAARAAQMEALGQLQAKYHAGGLDAIDRARVGDIQSGVNQTAAVQRGAVQEDARHRGVYSSGNALVDAQVAGQGSAMRGEQQGRDAAALAEQARTGAITGAAGVAGNIRGQDYAKASALDAISRFNAAQRLGRATSVADVGLGQAGVAENDAKRRYGEFKDIAKGGGNYMDSGGTSALRSWGT